MSVCRIHTKQFSEDRQLVVIRDCPKMYIPLSAEKNAETEMKTKMQYIIGRKQNIKKKKKKKLAQ